jgi:uncharacterized SAM-binding protein YcdF (DUF218 family)
MYLFVLGTILPSNRHNRHRMWLLAASFLFFFALVLFMNMGRWLVVEDPLEKASAMAVLSGRMPSRALEAARLYRAGYASEVWLTHSTEPGATLAKLSVPYSGEETYDKLILIHEGVPESAIRILDPPVVNTEDEILVIGHSLQQQTGHKVIIVTSKVHTRRSRALWNRLSAARGQAIIHGVSDDGFNAARWWHNTSDALDVVREIFGLLNLWAGLPLRPAA